MYTIKECVMHRSEGVCVVEDIRTERFPGAASRQYYILRPLYENGSTTVFLPVDSGEMRLRPLLTREQAKQLLQGTMKQELLWVDNDRARQERFNHLSKECDPATMVKLLSELWEHQEQQHKEGKKLRFFDEKMLQEVKRLLGQEMAYVMNITPETALNTLKHSLETISV